jgi:hypothetical protein
MQNFSLLVSGVTRFDQLYGMVNTLFEVVRSQFSGVQFPANPTVGQPCYRTDMTPPRLFTFNGAEWADVVSGSPAVISAVKEIQDARGSAASLEARLDVALNDDGTLKGNAPASDWWTQEADPVARLSENQFTVAGDKRAIYVKRRAVLLEQDADAKTHVTDVVYDGGTTIVSLAGRVVDAGLSGVSYGQEVGNEPLVMGFRTVIVEVTAPDGRHVVALSDLGIPPLSPGWFPQLQILGAIPYRATAQDVTPDAFTVRLFMPDGKPGAVVTSGIATSGSGLRCGNAVFCGQLVPVRGVKVGCLIPL